MDTMTPDVYYKILITDRGLVVVTMQNFDEWDYDEDHLLPFMFETKEEAELWMLRIYRAIK